MTPAELAELLPLVAAVAREAGRTIREREPSRAAARRKADGSLVTDADEAAEAVILPAIERLSNWPVVSEESFVRHNRSFAMSAPPPFYWLVDPLDGTREFVDGRTEYCVNIALVAAAGPIFGRAPRPGDAPILGVVHAPAENATWAGAGPGTATRADGDGAPRPVRVRRPPKEGLAVVSSRNHGDGAALASFLEPVTVASHRRLGSAIKFGLVAEGSADVYPRIGPTMEWDTAAGQALVEAAGGFVTSLDRERLTCRHSQWRNPDFVAIGAWPDDVT